MIQKNNMNWSYAIINNRIGEIYFNKDKEGRMELYGHCYVTEEQKSQMCKEERKFMEENIKGGKIIYRNKKYKVIKTQ